MHIFSIWALLSDETFDILVKVGYRWVPIQETLLSRDYCEVNNFLSSPFLLLQHSSKCVLRSTKKELLLIAISFVYHTSFVPYKFRRKMETWKPVLVESIFFLANADILLDCITGDWWNKSKQQKEGNRYIPDFHLLYWRFTLWTFGYECPQMTVIKENG